MTITINGSVIPTAEKYEIVLDAGGDAPAEMGPVVIRVRGDVFINHAGGASLTIIAEKGGVLRLGGGSPVVVG